MIFASLSPSTSFAGSGTPLVYREETSVKASVAPPTFLSAAKLFVPDAWAGSAANNRRKSAHWHPKSKAMSLMSYFNRARFDASRTAQNLRYCLTKQLFGNRGDELSSCSYHRQHRLGATVPRDTKNLLSGG